MTYYYTYPREGRAMEMQTCNMDERTNEEKLSDMVDELIVEREKYRQALIRIQTHLEFSAAGMAVMAGPTKSGWSTSRTTQARLSASCGPAPASRGPCPSLPGFYARPTTTRAAPARRLPGSAHVKRTKDFTTEPARRGG